MRPVEGLKKIFKFSSVLFSTRVPLQFFQKQPSRYVLIKRCCENMHQIYRGTPMSKCDFNKVALSLYWILHGCSLVNGLHIFWTPFPSNTSWGLLLFLPTILALVKHKQNLVIKHFLELQIVNQKKNTRSSHRRCFTEKLLLKISQNSQENTSARVFF